MENVYSAPGMSPLMGLDDNGQVTADFNYYDFDASFIPSQQDLDMDYLAEESSGSGSGSGSSKTLSDGRGGSNSQLNQEIRGVSVGGASSSTTSSSPSLGQYPMPTSARQVPVIAPAGPIPVPVPATQPPSSALYPSFHSPERLARGQEMARTGLRLASPVTSGGNMGPGTSAAALSKQRMERRGHTKSRRGCFNCKRRRIKCQETRPACGHCIKTGLNCEYPAVPQVVHQPQHQIPIFSLQDMRLFQHFLLQCYPHYPIGAENIWTHEIPCLSEKYEYLMHAILGFAASELINTDPSLIESAMSHRLKAIKAIKKSLNDVSSSTSTSSTSSCSNNTPPKGKENNFTEEGNALMATCFALTFQSVWLDDGMSEYMTFIRGIVIVAYQMYMRGAATAGKFLFGAYLGEKQNEVLEPFMRRVGLIQREWALGAVNGIKGLEGLLPDLAPLPDPSPSTATSCFTPPEMPSENLNNSATATVVGDGVRGGENIQDKISTERAYYHLILDMAEKCLVSSWEAYKALTVHYAWWMMLPHDQFEKLIDPSNQVAVLLATHWIALKQVMARITEVEKMGFAKVPEGYDQLGKKAEEVEKDGGKEANKHDMDVGIIRWLKFLNRSVEPHYRKYNSWPEWVEEQLDRDLGYFGRGSVKCGGSG